jgi:NAD-dependent dihydropyrimidine dehydrogenase PreA subunit
MEDTKKTGNRADIDPSQCKGCRLCVEICPKNCLTIASDINVLGYQYAKFEKAQCSACGLCYYVCPEPGAVKVYAEDKAKHG